MRKGRPGVGPSLGSTRRREEGAPRGPHEGLTCLRRGARRGFGSSQHHQSPMHSRQTAITRARMGHDHNATHKVSSTPYCTGLFRVGLASPEAVAVAVAVELEGEGEGEGNTLRPQGRSTSHREALAQILACGERGSRAKQSEKEGRSSKRAKRNTKPKANGLGLAETGQAD